MKTTCFILLSVFTLSLYSCKNCADCKRGDRFHGDTERQRICEKDFPNEEAYRAAVGVTHREGWLCVDGRCRISANSFDVRSHC